MTHFPSNSSYSPNVESFETLIHASWPGVTGGFPLQLVNILSSIGGDASPESPYLGSLNVKILDVTGLLWKYGKSGFSYASYRISAGFFSCSNLKYKISG